MSFSRYGFTRSGGYSSEVGRIASWASWALLPRHLGDHELFALERFDQGPGDFAARDLRLLPVEPDQLRPELRREGGAQIRLDAPVLDRNELGDLLLALHHQPHCHALDPAGGEPTADLLPEDG